MLRPKHSAPFILFYCVVVATGIFTLSNEIQVWYALDDVGLKPHSRDRVVVSMTTFSDRIMVTGMYAIRSVLSQKYDRFIISIPMHSRKPPVNTSCAHMHDCIAASPPHNASEADVLSFLGQELGSFTLVASNMQTRTYENAAHAMVVQFLPLDYGPATKLLGALLIERDPSTVIVTVDDDIVYDPNLIDVLTTYIPLDSALCTACQASNPWANSSDLLMIHDGTWLRWLWRQNAKKCPGWLVGWAGVAYRVSFFGPDVFNVTMPHGCFYNDDVWISGYLRRKGVGLLVMPGIKGGIAYRHPTLSLTVRANTQEIDMDPCIQFWQPT